MLHVFALGAVGGVVCGALKRLCSKGSDVDAAAAAAAAVVDGSSIADIVVQPRSRCSNLLRDRKALAIAASTVCACAAAAGLLGVRQRRNRRRKGSKADRTDGRIPLQDLIRFKERQWFVEELENAREADPNAMLRLAKMYLHGQGCQCNIALAQEWVRKARNMGVPASLDELFATDDPDPRGRLRSLMAQEERRRAARKMSSGSSGYPQQQQRYTSAA